MFGQLGVWALDVHLEVRRSLGERNWLDQDGELGVVITSAKHGWRF